MKGNKLLICIGYANSWKNEEGEESGWNMEKEVCSFLSPLLSYISGQE